MRDGRRTAFPRQRSGVRHMRIHSASRFRVSLLLLLVASLSLACWQSPTTGPGEIKWDRQTCERCQMVISERHHAVQTRRTGERAVHAFDDLGCALLWLDEHGGLDSRPRPELWVRHSAGTMWTDAHTARFEPGHLTPMQYGWVVADGGSLLQAVREQVREAERLRRSAPGGAAVGRGERGG